MWIQIAAIVVVLALILFGTARLMRKATEIEPDDAACEPTEAEAEYDPLAHERIRASLIRTREIHDQLQRAKLGPQHDGQEL